MLTINVKSYSDIPMVGAFITIWPDGEKAWYFNGVLHRTDGPAVEEPDGYKEWCLNGELHRLDGPAVEEPDGSKAWYLNGIKMTKKQWGLEKEHWIQMEIKEEIKEMVV
jgi:hypothetical protein